MGRSRSRGRDSTAVSIVFALLFVCFHCFSTPVSAGSGGRRGEHPFITACRTGDTDTVQTFIAQQGFDINALLAGGRRLLPGAIYRPRTGLYAAVVGNQPQVVEQLLGIADADVNKRVHNCSPIWAAAHRNRIECAKILIAHRAEFNLDDGYPPLYIASYCGHDEMVRLLLDNGANPQFKDAILGDYGPETPLYGARVMRLLNPWEWTKYTKIIRLLKDYSQPQPANETTPLLLGASSHLGTGKL